MLVHACLRRYACAWHLESLFADLNRQEAIRGGSNRPLGSLTRTRAATMRLITSFKRWRRQNQRAAMGKAATNERIKITAAYLNNIATSIFAAGIILPYLSLAGRPANQG